MRRQTARLIPCGHTPIANMATIASKRGYGLAAFVYTNFVPVSTRFDYSFFRPNPVFFSSELIISKTVPSKKTALYNNF